MDPLFPQETSLITQVSTKEFTTFQKNPFFLLSPSETLFLREVFSAEKFTSVQDLVKVLNLIHFWPDERLVTPAFSCFLKSSFPDFWEDPDDSLEISTEIFNCFFDRFLLQDSDFQFKMKKPMRVTQKSYNRIFDQRFFVLFSLCKNTGIRELVIQRETCNGIFLLEQILKRNPTLEKVNLNFQPSVIFKRAFGQIDFKASNALLAESIESLQKNEYQNVCKIENLKIYKLPTLSLKMLSCFFSRLKSLELTLKIGRSEPSLCTAILLEFPPSIESLSVSFEIDFPTYEKYSPITPKMSCPLPFLKELKIRTVIYHDKYYFDWTMFFGNFSLNFPSLETFAFKFDKAPNSLLKLSLEKLAAINNLVSLSLTFSDCYDLLIDLFGKYSKFLVKLSHLSLRAFLDKDAEINFDCALPNLKCFKFFVNSGNRLSNFGLFFMQNPQIKEIHCSGGSKMANLPNILAGLETFQITGDPFNAKHRVNALNLKTLSLSFIPENWIFSNLKSFELIIGFNFNVKFEHLALLESLEELSIESKMSPLVRFSLKGINCLKHLRLLRICHNSITVSKKSRWLTDRGKYTGTSLKDLELTAPSVYIFSWVLELFKGSNVNLRFVAPRLGI